LPDEPDPAPKPHRNPNAEYEEYDGSTYGFDKPGGRSRSKDEDEEEPASDPRDKPLPDFRLGSGQRGKKRGRKKN
jgi:hypothetical protein